VAEFRATNSRIGATRYTMQKLPALRAIAPALRYRRHTAVFGRRDSNDTGNRFAASAS